MAITYLTGIPRSGKTYYAMYLLYTSFIAPKRKETKLSKFLTMYSSKTLKKSYDVAYTNINQFDFSKSPNIKPYDHEALYQHLEYLHAMYLAKKTDDELIDHAKKYDLLNALFVIDECQNFFSKEDKVLTWWFTYHGHLHQDIILITQNLDLIHNAYTKIAEFFYKAVSPSSRFFSNKFRYIQFNSYKCYKSEKIGDFHVPMVLDIFNMYVSGAINASPSQVKKYLLIFVFLFIMLLIAFKFFISQFQDEKKVSTQKEIIENNQTTLKSVTPLDKKELLNNDKLKSKDDHKKDDKEIKDELFEIRCIDMLCKYKDIDFPKPLLNKLTLKLEPEFIWFFNDGSYIQYFVMLPSNTFDFLQKIEKNKKDVQNGATTKKEVKSSTNHLPIAVPISK